MNLMNKKAYVTHPVTLFIVGLIVGIILVLLVTKGVVNLPSIASAIC